MSRKSDIDLALDVYTTKHSGLEAVKAAYDLGRADGMLWVSNSASCRMDIEDRAARLRDRVRMMGGKKPEGGVQ